MVFRYLPPPGCPGRPTSEMFVRVQRAGDALVSSTFARPGLVRTPTIPSMSPLRIVIVSDHQTLADALIARLGREPDGFLVEHRRSGDALPRTPRPDVVGVYAH